MRHALAAFPPMALLFLLAAGNVSAEDPPDTLEPAPPPGKAKRCSLIQVTMTSNGGHESTQVLTSNLRFVRAWMHHKGWDTTDQPGVSFHGSAYEWTMAWNGPPTWEFEVVGEVGTMAEIQVKYQKSSWGDWYYTEKKQILILRAEPRITLREVPEIPDGLRMDGQSWKRIEALVTECGEPVPEAHVTFTTNLGRLDEMKALPYTFFDLFNAEFSYPAEQALSATDGVTVRTDEGSRP